MNYSHSKLTTLLSCPMTYYLSYVQHIYKKEEKPAFAIGSAVHWGIEHNTEDLGEYWGNINYDRDQWLSEAMVHGYMKHKDEIFNELLQDSYGNSLQLIQESHEVTLTAKLGNHTFLGIIDLLILTDKGFVLIDYKTSSQEPDFDKYLDQIYRYIYLLKSNFPDIPIIKIGIINLRKTGIRQKKNENPTEYINRLKFEYEINDENYVNYHEFRPESLEEKHIEHYISNLEKMCDAGQCIVDNKNFYINFANAMGTYGKSDYWDIFYHTPDAHVLYKISDKYINDFDEIVDSRDCIPLDMLTIDNDNILNHYTQYKEELDKVSTDINNVDFEDFHKLLKSKYLTDDNLLKNYEKVAKL